VGTQMPGDPDVKQHDNPPSSRFVQMVMDDVPNKDEPHEGGIIVEGVMGLELKRSRVQHTVFTVSRHCYPAFLHHMPGHSKCQDNLLWSRWLQARLLLQLQRLQAQPC
jgi:hypothetical protein